MWRDQVAIIIPSLNPDRRLLELLRDLTQRGFAHIYLVNDGSDPDRRVLFQKAVEDYHCHLMVHAINQGKGRALKSAFNAVLQSGLDLAGAVTVDGDGQHHIDDIDKCAKALYENPERLVLGCRDFNKKDVPLKSKFGNVITRGFIKFFCGIKTADTQTGLRGIPMVHMKEIFSIKGEAYDFETAMIVETKIRNIKILEVPIRTIYLDGNQSSHFNPIKDSFIVYKMLLKFSLSSIVSFALDILIFTIAIFFLRHLLPVMYVFAANAIARLLSSILNYRINKTQVFKHTEGNVGPLVKYFILCALQITASSLLVMGVYHFIKINESIIKVFVDLFLFFISFQIQQHFVFKNKEKS